MSSKTMFPRGTKVISTRTPRAVGYVVGHLVMQNPWDDVLTPMYLIQLDERQLPKSGSGMTIPVSLMVFEVEYTESFAVFEFEEAKRRESEPKPAV